MVELAEVDEEVAAAKEAFENCHLLVVCDAVVDEGLPYHALLELEEILCFLLKHCPSCFVRHFGVECRL